MSPNGFAAASTISGHFSASCCPMIASWWPASASARALIASASAIPRALIASPSARPLAWVADASACPIIRDCVAVASASTLTRSGGQLDACGVGAGLELDLFGARFRLLDVRVSLGPGERDLLVRPGVGGLADLDQKLLLLALGFQLCDASLLDHDLLTCRRVRQRAGLPGKGCCAVHLSLVARLPDLRVTARLSFLRLSLLFLLGRFAIGLGSGDARFALDGRSVGLGQVLYVAGRVEDLLDLEGVHYQAELLHFG